MPVSGVAISPNNRWLVTNSFDGTGRIWDFHSVAMTELPTVAGIDLQPAHIWDALGTKIVGSTRVLNGVGTFKDGQTLTITADSNRLVTTGETGLRRWNLESENPGSSMVLQSHTLGVGPVAVSLDGHWLVTGSDDKTARLWDLQAEDPSARSIVLEGHTEEIRQLAISPDSRWLVTCTGLWRERSAGKETTVRVWDLDSPGPRKAVRILQGHAGPITSISISPDSKKLVTGIADATARVWNLLGDATSSQVLRGNTGRIKSVAFSSDSLSVITGGAGDDGIACNIHIWK